MAALALGAKPSVVDIVFGMAADAAMSRFQRIDERLRVTGFAIDFLVGAVQAVAGL